MILSPWSLPFSGTLPSGTGHSRRYQRENAKSADRGNQHRLSANGVGEMSAHERAKEQTGASGCEKEAGRLSAGTELKSQTRRRNASSL
jgi:hypothetical protein